MGCEDDDTCDQPATKWDIEGIYASQLIIGVMVGIILLGGIGLERRL